MTTLYNYGIDPALVDLVKKIASTLDNENPLEGTIVDVDGVYADVRVAGKGTIYRHCPVIGDANTLVPGQLVALRWINGRAFVLASTLPTTSISQQTFQPDGVTLENSPYGIRVVPGSIRQSHLAFIPSLEGHTHGDSLTLNGWSVDDDGVITQGNVNIHPTGQISLGLSPNVIKLDAQHSTHRIWVGDVLPANADFSVEKDGKMNASAGTIAGWDILSDRLSKNGAELQAAGQLILGSGNDVAVLSAVNVDDYRLWIGHADPASAPFRVKKTGEVWLDNAHIAMDLESSNYVSGQSGWHIDSAGWAEFQDVIVRGTFTAVTFKNDVTSVLSGRQVVTDGAVFISDVGTGDTTIDIDVNIFEIDDILQSQPRPGVSEWMKVTSGPTTITGGYRYSVTRTYDGGSPDYETSVISEVGSGNIAGYWPLDEASGATADDRSANSNDGVYETVTYQDAALPAYIGSDAPYFDGASTDVVNISAIDGEFNGEEGFISAWFKVPSGAWTDGTSRYLINIYRDASNYVNIFKSAVSNRLTLNYRSGGTTKSLNIDSLSSTDWYHVALVWSQSGDYVKFYLNNSLQDTQTGLGIWSNGALYTQRVAIGDYQHTTPVSPFNGHIGHAMVGTVPIDANAVSTLYYPALGQQFYAGENIFRKGLATLPVEAPTIGSYDMQMGSYGAFVGGSPFITAGGFLTLEGSRLYGPYFGVARRFGATYSQIDDVVRIGRLKGFLDIPGDEYGIAIGDRMRNMIYTYASGLQINTRGGATRIDDDGITSDKFSLTPGQTPLYEMDKGILYIDEDARQLRIAFRDATRESDTLIAQL